MTERFRLPAELQMGRVVLRVADLARTVNFWRDGVGLHVLEEGDGYVRLGAPALRNGNGRGEGAGAGGRGAPPKGGPFEELVRLVHVPGAVRPAPGSPGLYHLAILLPRRRDLARALLRLHRFGARFQGFSDHGVSEAIYLADPEGNGLEIYVDRPRDRWRWHGDTVHMYTLPLDVDDLVAELQGSDAVSNGRAGEAGEDRLPAGSRIGHVHLHVTDLARAEAFYSHVLGLDVVNRTYPGALFMSAGRYHHHVAVNTWGTRRAAVGASRDGAGGLEDFALLLPPPAVEEVAARWREAGLDPVEVGGGERGWRVNDPDGNGVAVMPL